MPNQIGGKHVFAIFIEGLVSLIPSINKLVCIKGRDLEKRVTKVLRVSHNEKLIIFDDEINVKVELQDGASKEGFLAKVLEINNNKPLEPNVTLACPIIKKETFEDVVYFATALGVKRIIPVITEKTKRDWGGERELLRLRRKSIAASEQSKNFYLPKIEEPKTFKEVVTLEGFDFKINFNPLGCSIMDLVDRLKETQNILVTLGPEGGFADLERLSLEKGGFEFMALTPTILKTEHAVAVGIGSIRCLV